MHINAWIYTHYDITPKLRYTLIEIDKSVGFQWAELDATHAISSSDKLSNLLTKPLMSETPMASV